LLVFVLFRVLPILPVSIVGLATLACSFSLLNRLLTHVRYIVRF